MKDTRLMYRTWPLAMLSSQAMVEEMLELNWEIYGYSEFVGGEPKYVEWVHCGDHSFR